MKQLRKHWLRYLAHLGALAPFALLLWDGSQDQLTVNPIQEITARTGKTALILLVLTLACTPLNTILGWKQVLPLRRPLGLWAFFYASLHFLTFSILDYGLDLLLIQETIIEKPYVLVGFAAFVLLIPLALTSTKGWMKRLGKNWKLLHRLIYLVGILVILHYIWLVKADIREPLAYGAVVAASLAVRIPAVKRFFTRLHSRRAPAAKRKTPAAASVTSATADRV